jgi:predicted RNase H-like HicB family nuclease
MPENRTTSFRYPIVICWDDEQQAYIADVPDLPTPCTGSGATYAEALASVLEALEWWQERTHRTRQPPAPRPLDHPGPGERSS